MLASAIQRICSGLRDPNGIIFVARTAGAARDVPLLPRDVIRSVNNRRVASLDWLRESIALSRQAHR